MPCEIVCQVLFSLPESVVKCVDRSSVGGRRCWLWAEILPTCSKWLLPLYVVGLLALLQNFVPRAGSCFLTQDRGFQLLRQPGLVACHSKLAAGLGFVSVACAEGLLMHESGPCYFGICHSEGVLHLHCSWSVNGPSSAPYPFFFFGLELYNVTAFSPCA